MATATTKRTPAKRRTTAAPAEVELDDQAVDVDDVDQDDDALEGVVVVPPELTFTTPKKDRPAQTEEERAVNFSIDGEVYTVIRPAKLQEAISGLIEAGARRATEADILFAGSTFLRKVLAPESLARINARLEDDADDFEITDLFDNLEQLVLHLIRTAPAGALPGRAGAPVAARRRAVR